MHDASAQTVLIAVIAADAPPPTTAAGNKPPKSVREWAYLTGGISVALILLIVALAVVMLARRRARMRALQSDWRTRRAAEKSAWQEAGRRAEAPTAEQLEDNGKDA
jgi:hypothetical protein